MAISSYEDVNEVLEQASQAAQRFLTTKDGGAFVQAVTLLQSVLSSPYKIPAAGFGIGLLCYEMARHLLDPEKTIPADCFFEEKYFEKAKDLLSRLEPEQKTIVMGCFEKAGKYYLIAAAMPDDKGFNASRAKLSLADLIDHSLVAVAPGMDRDKTAFALVLEAAESGFAEAQMSAANMYYAGRGVEKSLERALMWMKEAQKNKDQLSPKFQKEVACAIGLIENALAAANLPKPAGKPSQNNNGAPSP